MRHLFTFFFIVITLTGFAQEAFNNAIKIADNEQEIIDLDEELITAYSEAYPFKLIASEIITVQQFIENPFSPDIKYSDIDVNAPLELIRLVEDNRIRKEDFPAEEFEDLLKPCFEQEHLTYEQFLRDDKIILGEYEMECYESMFEAFSEYEEYGELDEVEIPTAYGEHPNPPVASSYVPAVGVANLPTKLVDGTAQFLVERVKEELLLAFFDRFLQRVENSRELKALLPNTRVMLNKQDIFRVPSMGAVWVTAFEEDMRAFHVNLERLILTDEAYTEARQKAPVQLFLIANFTFEQIQRETKPMDMLLALDKRFADSEHEIGLTVSLMGRLVSNLISNDKMISIQTYNKLNDRGENAKKYFTGLIYQQDRPLFERVNVGQQSMASLMQQHHISFTDRLVDLIYLVGDIQEKNKTFRKAKVNANEEAKQYKTALMDYSETIFSVLDFGYNMRYFVTPELAYSPPYHTTYRPTALATVRAIQAGIEEDYPATILYAIQIVEPLTDARIGVLEKQIKELKSGEHALTTYDAKIKRIEAEKELKMTREVVKNLAFYGGFMVDILSAESGVAVKGIIDKYAAPVGSYRVKRQNPASVSLSAYPGVYGGIESISSNDNSWVAGVTAPIGLSINHGTKRGHSVSLFGSVIDIGAAFSYRWQNGEAEGFPAEIRWEQIISPGAHIVWGLPKAPLALMVGGQYTPQLRKITTDDVELQANAWRIGATLTVDIPIVHFYR